MSKAQAQMLPNDINALKKLILARDEELEKQKNTLTKKDNILAERDRKIAILEEYVRLLKHKQFGKSGERFVSDQQESLFNEAEHVGEDQCEEELAQNGEESRSQDANAQTQTKQSRPGRRKLPESLPRFKVFHELSDLEQQCPCGCQMQAYDEVISEQLGIIPAELYVIQHCRKKYRCMHRKDQAPKTAPLPAQPFPKSNASPELMADIAISKFLDGLPFYRQEQIWKRMDIDFPRATMARWSIEAGNLVQPLINLLAEQQTNGAVMHIDETPVQVLKEPGKEPESKKYFWVTASGPPGKPIYLFHYNPSRGSAVAEDLLQGFSGTVMSDD